MMRCICLIGPSAFDESQREPVEQFRVSRAQAKRAEVVRRADDALPEMPEPNPVGHHSGGERIIAGQPLGEPGAAAAVLRRGRRVLLAITWR